MKVKDTKRCRHKFIHSEHYWAKRKLFFGMQYFFCVGVPDQYSWVNLPLGGGTL